MKVGDTVRVINPAHSDYGRDGRVTYVSVPYQGGPIVVDVKFADYSMETFEENEVQEM